MSASRITRLRASRFGLLPRWRTPFPIRRHTSTLQQRPERQRKIKSLLRLARLALVLTLPLLPGVLLALALPPFPPWTLLGVELRRDARELVLPDGRHEHPASMAGQRAGVPTRHAPRVVGCGLGGRRNVGGRGDRMNGLVVKVDFLVQGVCRILREEAASCCAAGLQILEDFTITVLRNTEEPAAGSTLVCAYPRRPRGVGSLPWVTRINPELKLAESPRQRDRDIVLVGVDASYIEKNISYDLVHRGWAYVRSGWCLE